MAGHHSLKVGIYVRIVGPELFSAVYKKFNDLSAVLLSNLAGLLIDSVLFSFIAFLGVLPLTIVLEIILTNILVKLAMSILSAPAIKLVPRR